MGIGHVLHKFNIFNMTKPLAEWMEWEKTFTVMGTEHYDFNVKPECDKAFRSIGILKKTMLYMQERSLGPVLIDFCLHQMRFAFPCKSVRMQNPCEVVKSR